jgi:hypothetical protein
MRMTRAEPILPTVEYLQQQWLRRVVLGLGHVEYGEFVDRLQGVWMVVAKFTLPTPDANTVPGATRSKHGPGLDHLPLHAR